jgi:uncharacterized protein
MSGMRLDSGTPLEAKAFSGALAPEKRPFLGFGLGLRVEHFDRILADRPRVDWFEIISENFMVEGGKPLHYLDAIRADYPLAMHGVSLSIGSTDPLDVEYLGKLKALAQRVEPVWISDHLCWTGVGGINSHDLLPLPYTEEAIAHVCSRIHQVQDILGQPILLENLSAYVEFAQSHLTEWEFISEIAARSGCRLLLDVNNIQVSARNQGFDPREYLRGIPADRVWQIHLAGHSDYGDYAIDTHDHDVPDSVWSLYEDAIRRLGPVSTMIERDDHIPPLDELLQELEIARRRHAHALDAESHRSGGLDANRGIVSI